MKDTLFLNEEGIIHYKASEFTEAVSCWRRAADLGSAGAMFELGVMYLTGCGVEKDSREAGQWLQRAADLGHKNASQYLADGDLQRLESETFGMDEIDAAFSHSVEFGGYEWLVLEHRGNMSLCLTKYIISIRPYHEKQEAVTWKKCTLRQWLNEEFIGSFGQERMCITQDAGHEDKMFLLSAEEAEKYLGPADEMRRTVIRMSPAQLSECSALYGHSYEKINGHSLGWWLRDSGESMDKAARVNCHGRIRTHGRVVNSRLDGVRPACWVKFNGGKKDDR